MTTLRAHLKSVISVLDGPTVSWPKPPTDAQRLAELQARVTKAQDLLRNLPELEDWPVRATEPNPQRAPLEKLIAEAEVIRVYSPTFRRYFQSQYVTDLQNKFGTFVMHAKEACERALVEP